jgi:hypothetical protein
MRFLKLGTWKQHAVPSALLTGGVTNSRPINGGITLPDTHSVRTTDSRPYRFIAVPPSQRAAA